MRKSFPQNLSKQSLLSLDRALTDRLRISSQNSPGWRAAVFLGHTGDSWFWAIGVGLVWIFTGWLGSPYWHRLSAIFEIAIVAQALLVFAIKSQIRRQRPSGDWGGIYRQIDPHSFPSGHATRAAMLAVLAVALGPGWLGWLIVVWAPFMSIARVMTGVHYVSDLLGGALLGLILGLLTLVIYPLWIQWFPFLF